MSLPNQQQIEVIATKILFDAKEAITDLKLWNLTVAQGAEKVAYLKALISATAKQMNGDVKSATQAVANFSNALDVNPTLIRSVGNEMQTAGQKGESGFKRAATAVNAMKIALGVLVSMLIFQVIQAIQQAFSTALESLRDFESTLYRLSNVERELSLKGVEISVEGLRNGIEEIKKLFPIFSEEDIAEMVGGIAQATSHLGLSEKQILDLAKAVAVLNVQSTEEETLLQTQQKLISAIVTSQSRGVGNLGITFSANAMEKFARDLKLISENETIRDLTDPEKTQVKLAIVLDKAGINDAQTFLESMPEYFQSTAAKSEELSATWEDFLKNIAIQFRPLILEFLQLAIDNIELWNQRLEESKPALDYLVATLSGIVRIFNALNEQESPLDKLSPSLGMLDKLGKIDIGKEFSEGFEEAKQNIEDFGKVVETPTALNIDSSDAGMAADALADLDDKLQDIILDAEQAREELDLLLSQKREDIEIKAKIKLEDIELEYQRKIEDAARDLANKIEDINRDAQRRIDEVRERARIDELEAEMELAQKLKELRNQFLMDLEDALHARDARQVLRLTRNYNNEKQNLLDRYALEEKLRQLRLQAELRAIEEERRARIEEAQIEYQQKLEDLAIAKERELEELKTWKEREYEELQLWYKREQEEIDKNIKDKLEKLLQGYIQEGKITQQGMENVVKILEHYAEQGKYVVADMVAFALAELAKLDSAMAGVGTTPPPPSTGDDWWNDNPSNSPTSALGESIAQMPSRLNLARLSSPTNGFSSGGRGLGGSAAIHIMLSPDLEGRITENALSETARVIVNTMRGIK